MSNQSEAILSTPLDPDIHGATTVREYLEKLLILLIIEADGFSGEQPFGNPDWIYQLATPLCKAGLVEVHKVLDEGGEPVELAPDWTDFDEKLEVAIKHVFQTTN